jgi:MerR family transcriptional regulator, light-induced transcriptional regulator
VEHGRDELRSIADVMSGRFGDALLAGDPPAAEQIAREALDLSIGEATLYELVIGPAMHRIGRLWAEGAISVAHEHLATQITTRVLVLAHELTALPKHRGGQRAIFAAVEGERHVLALDMAGKLLESAGYEVLALGPDVPTDSLPAIVADHHPALMALSATMPETGARLPEAVDAVTHSDAGVGLILGGDGVPPAMLFGPRVVVEESIAGVVDAADALVRRAGLN